MDMPDKIYLNKFMLRRGMMYPAQPPADIPECEYIRKDIADGMIESAEDHAYFAGQEKLREKLLEWAKEKKAQLLEEAEPTDVTIGIFGGLDLLIGEIESL